MLLALLLLLVSFCTIFKGSGFLEKLVVSQGLKLFSVIGMRFEIKILRVTMTLRVCVLGKIFQLRDKKLPDTFIYKLLEILGSRLITRPMTLKQPRRTPCERLAMRAGFWNQT